MSALLELAGVDKSFHGAGDTTHACRSVDLHVGEGEVVGLVGESGSGKSTLANVALGLLEPDHGEVRFDGRPLRDWLRREPRRFRSQVQAVFQQPLLALDGRRRIGWSVAEPLRIHGVGDRAERRARVAGLLERVGLEPAIVDRWPRELSGGQLQRVNIARALALEPRLLVCDEPVSALDVSVQAQILNLFLDIQREAGTAMLFISHDLAVVRHVSDRLVVLYAGRVVEHGPAAAVCDRPQHPYTRALLAASLEPETVEGGERPGVPPGAAPGAPPAAVAGRSPVAPAGSPAAGPVGLSVAPAESLLGAEGLPAEGCRFAPRCPLAEPECRTAEPDLRSLEPGRATACRRAEQLAGAGQR
jgi:ABC-type glutathione transport system ATPase component